MSDPPTTPALEQIPQSSSQATEMPHPENLSLDEAVYKCACGVPETSELWICCDNDNCAVKWYHWQCVRVTEELPGHWLCPSCSLAPMKDSKRLGTGQDAEISGFPKPRKTTGRSSNDHLNHQATRKQRPPNPRPKPLKKGIAVKKSLSKTKPKWTGWVEMPSEDEDAHKESDEVSGEATAVAKARQTKTRVIQSMAKSTRPRMPRGGSNSAAGANREASMVSERKERDKTDSNHFAQNSNQQLTTPQPTSPRTPKTSPPASPPTTPHHATAITVEPQATTVSPNGSSAVTHWSYRTNTRYTDPDSAMRCTLPRLL